MAGYDTEIIYLSVMGCIQHHDCDTTVASCLYQYSTGFLLIKYA